MKKGTRKERKRSVVLVKPLARKKKGKNRSFRLPESGPIEGREKRREKRRNAFLLAIGRGRKGRKG